MEKQKRRHSRDLFDLSDKFRGLSLSERLAAIDALALLTFLRLLDVADDQASPVPTTELFPGQATRFKWPAWCKLQGRELLRFLDEEVFRYMASLVKEDPQIAEFYRDARLRVLDPDLISALVRYVNELPLDRWTLEDKERWFEELLTVLFDFAKEFDFRTPQPLARAVIEILGPSPDETIFNPGCGTAGLLVEVLRYFRTRFPAFDEGRAVRQRTLRGVEISRSTFRLAVLNLRLRGLIPAPVVCADVFDEYRGSMLEPDGMQRSGDAEGSEAPAYRVVVADVPTAPPTGSGTLAVNSPQASSRDARGGQFWNSVINALALGGRGAVIVPRQVLAMRSSSLRFVREELLRRCDRVAVVLPPIAKPDSRAELAMVLFRRRQSKSLADHLVLFSGTGPAEDAWQYTHRDIRRFLTHDDYTNRGIEADTTLPPGSEEPRCWWTTAVQIAANDYSIDPSHYRPRVLPAEMGDPVALLREAAQLQRELLSELAALLREVES
jgi:type I restriction enzyme M protein